MNRRRQATSPFPPFTPRELLEVLESRLLLTNIHAVGVSIVDANNHPISSPYVVGTYVYVHTDLTVNGLGGASSYTISQSIGSQTYTNVVNYGAGVSGTPSYYQWWGAFGIVAGANQTVSVTLDSTNAISETNEGDNTLSFTFTPVSLPLPTKFAAPLGGTAFVNYGFNNYVDLDPNSNSIVDYRGGDYTYDGHSGWDIDPANFQAMDNGVPILAAAPGTVTYVADGNFDRRLGTPPPDALANFVQIDNGNGWTTLYYHMRLGSVGVSVGQQVAAGQVLGMMGSSGFSSGVHLHFEVDHPNGFETNTDPNTYWLNPYPYQGDVNAVIGTEITSFNPSSILNNDEQPPASPIFKQASGQTAYIRATLFTKPNAGFTAQWYKPNGTLYSTQTSNPNYEVRGGYWYFSMPLPSTPDLGIWHVNFLVGGILMAVNTFQVTADGSPELRLDSAGTYMPDGRTTPIDFGTVTQNNVLGNQTLTLTNYGTAPLLLGPPILPPGFTLVKPPAALLAPGASDTLVVGLNTAIPGNRYGFVYLPSNDADDAYFRFAVTGNVAPSAGPPVVSVYSRDQRAAAANRDPAIFLIQRTGSTAAALTVNFHMSGTAANGSDYDAIGTTVTIPAGSSFAKVIVTPKANVSFATWRSANITLDAGGYVLAADYATAGALITDALDNATYGQPVLPGKQIQYTLAPVGPAVGVVATGGVPSSLFGLAPAAGSGGAVLGTCGLPATGGAVALAGADPAASANAPAVGGGGNGGTARQLFAGADRGGEHDGPMRPAASRRGFGVRTLLPAVMPVLNHGGIPAAVAVAPRKDVASSTVLTWTLPHPIIAAHSASAPIATRAEPLARGGVAALQDSVPRLGLVESVLAMGDPKKSLLAIAR